MEWLTVSKAAERSRSGRRVTLLLSRADSMSVQFLCCDQIDRRTEDGTGVCWSEGVWGVELNDLFWYREKVWVWAVVSKILVIQGRFLRKGPCNSRFEGLREGAGHQRVIYNGCNVEEECAETLFEEGSWQRVKLTSFYAELPDDVLDGSHRNRMKCCKGLT